MRLSIAVFLIIGAFAKLSVSEGVIDGNGSQEVAVLGRDGVPMPILEAALNLDYFDDALNITKRDGNDWLTDVAVLPLIGSNTTSVESGVLDKHSNREDSGTLQMVFGKPVGILSV